MCFIAMPAYTFSCFGAKIRENFKVKTLFYISRTIEGKGCTQA
jgi:hypothetical protein